MKHALDTQELRVFDGGRFRINESECEGRLFVAFPKDDSLVRHPLPVVTAYADAATDDGEAFLDYFDFIEEDLLDDFDSVVQPGSVAQ
jgi:hypothetical protein